MSLSAKIRDYDGSRPSAISKNPCRWRITARRSRAGRGRAGGKEKFTAGRIARCATIPASITSTGSANSRSRPICSAPPHSAKNLSTEGLTEKNVYIGDIFRWGEALIQVTQPRSPCFKLNYHFGISDMAQLMQKQRQGWLALPHYRRRPGFQRCAAGAGIASERRERA